MCTCCSSALCGTPHRKATSFAATGALLIGLAFLLPIVIRHVVESKVCDQLCVPEADAAQARSAVVVLRWAGAHSKTNSE